MIATLTWDPCPLFGKGGEHGCLAARAAIFMACVVVAGCAGGDDTGNTLDGGQASEPEGERLAIEIQYLGFPSEDPHFATYSLRDRKLEFEVHKGKPSVRQWEVSNAQIKHLEAVIGGVDRRAWNGVYWEPVFDGGMVVCRVNKGGQEFVFEGLNAWPSCFSDLLKAMDGVAGEEVGFIWKEMPEGLYFESYEAMEEAASEGVERMLEQRGRFPD